MSNRILGLSGSLRRMLDGLVVWTRRMQGPAVERVA
jgi:hypothetical protein